MVILFFRRVGQERIMLLPDKLADRREPANARSTDCGRLLDHRLAITSYHTNARPKSGQEDQT